MMSSTCVAHHMPQPLSACTWLCGITLQVFQAATWQHCKRMACICATKHVAQHMGQCCLELCVGDHCSSSLPRWRKELDSKRVVAQSVTFIPRRRKLGVWQGTASWESWAMRRRLPRQISNMTVQAVIVPLKCSHSALQKTAPI